MPSGAVFVGFYAAMSVAGLISAIVMRSRLSAGFTLLMLAAAILEARAEWAFSLTQAVLAGLAAALAYAVALRNRGVQTERVRFERLAYVDGLTGVANRRTFDETLERMWNVARRAHVPLAVAMIDIDHFKELNDSRGHQVGDECLRRVAALCSSVLRRAGDCFARYGGEEFAAILLNVDLEHAMTVAENIRQNVERDGGMTVSVGVAACVPQAGERPRSLVARADEALYRAKHDGRNVVRAGDSSPLSV
jgi:diguanylate cyclase (GGDEF)-like protein